MDGPGPGSHEMEKSFSSTQVRKICFCKTTGQRISYTDSYAKIFKKNPGPSDLKEIDRGYNAIGKTTLAAANAPPLI